MDFTNQVVVITGASMGIGEALAKGFADRGASVALSSRSLERTEAARARIGHADRTLALACDVADAGQVGLLAQKSMERFGRIDIWINNAGYGVVDAVESLDMGAVRRMFEVNVFGAVVGMQVVIPIMRKQGSGTIVNISSISGHIAVPHMGAYSASKFALNAFSYAAHTELMGTGVNVLNVCPGYIDTDFAVNAERGPDAKRLSASAKRGAPVEIVVDDVLDGIARGAREIFTPKKDKWLVRGYRTIPGFFEKKMREMLRPAAEVIAATQAARGRKA